MRPAVILLVAAGTLLGLAETSAQRTFVGSDVCKDCHWEQWSSFRGSGHPFALRADSSSRALPLPEGYEWSDITWVLGGHTRDTIYLDSDGYLITGINPGWPDEQVGRNQYNLQTDAWVDAYAGELKPFDCGGCHTTGFGAGGVNPLPGVQGTWHLDGVQCEACHGAASEHVVPPYGQIDIHTQASSCGGCHRNGDLNQVPAAGGFLLPNAQYNELLASPHDNRSCVECHDPHERADRSIRTDCTSCHAHVEMAERSAFAPLGRRHLDRGLRCWDCHMPYAVKSTVSASRWRADARSHLFRISLKPDGQMFTPDGSLSTGKLTAGVVCLGCHVEQASKWEQRGKPWKAERWARKHAKKIHGSQ